MLQEGQQPNVHMNRMSAVSIHGAFQIANCTMFHQISIWNIDARTTGMGLSKRIDFEGERLDVMSVGRWHDTILRNLNS